MIAPLPDSDRPAKVESMAAPRVSIVMASNDFGRLFENALVSCLQQDFEDYEILVIGNGLSDADFAAMARICSHPKVRLFRTDIRRLTFSLNLGLHEARGEYIVRMDADDISYPSRLATQVAFMDQNPDVAVCGSSCDLIDREDKVIGEWHYPASDKHIRRKLYYTNPICHPAVIFRRAPVIATGGYFSFFSEDYSLWAFMTLDPALRFANIPRKLIAYRANHSEHPRNASWRGAKANLAGVQLQLFAITRNFRWLLGSMVSVGKSMLSQFR